MIKSINKRGDKGLHCFTSRVTLNSSVYDIVLRQLRMFEGYYRFFTLLISLMMFEAYTLIKYCFKMTFMFLFVKFPFACHNYDIKNVHIPKFFICDKINNCVSVSLKQTLYCT